MILGFGGRPQGTGVAGLGGVVDGQGGIRLAGDTAIPPIADSGNIGIYGVGPTGIKGEGELIGVEGRSASILVSGVAASGPGVNGVGRPGILGSAADDSSRGGSFASRASAQVQLVPQRLTQRLPAAVTVTPSAIPGNDAPALP